MSSTADPTAEPTDSPGVINRLLRSLSIAKSGPANPPLPTIVVDPPPDTPNDVPQAPAEQPASDAVKPETKEPPGALGRLKSLTKFKREKKPDAQDAAAGGEAEPLGVITEESTTAPPAKGAPAKAPDPTPISLAQKIRSLIDVIPPVDPSKPLQKPRPVKKGPNGKPIPPADATPIQDTKLLAQLSNPSLMNGKKGGASVWSILESLDAPKHTDSDVGNGGGDSDDDSSDYSSVMMYAPLIPTSESTVELGRTEMRPVTKTLIVEGELVIEADAGKEKPKSLWSFPWPGKRKPAPVKQVQVWVPSQTKLSVQTTWWGYRLYLPPPVMLSLSATEIEVAKRAALITSVLQWIISHLPISIVPLPLQPAVLVLQRLAPYLTYIGSFIAWSWATIDEYDKGNGVILSATWLLPIALIPSTWPAPPAAPPAPPATPPSAPPAAPPAAPPSAPPAAPPAAPPDAPPAAPPAAPTSPTSPDAPTAPAAPPTTVTTPRTFLGNIFKSKAK